MADAKITQLTELTSADGADLLAVVDDVAGTPTTKKITLTNIAAWLAALTQTLTNKTLTSPKVGTAITDTNGNEIIKTPATASAVNEVTITNSATGNPVKIESTGGDTNIHLTLDAKGSAFTKVKVLRQDITTNSYVGNSVILTGWGYINVSSVQKGESSITFGITFADRPVVIANALSLTDSTPTHIGNFVSGPDNENKVWTGNPRNISTTGYTLGFRAESAFVASRYMGYSWIAIGQLN